jgi:hypothetical protein
MKLKEEKWEQSRVEDVWIVSMVKNVKEENKKDENKKKCFKNLKF